MYSPFVRKRASGITLSETGLVIATIAIVAIAAVSVLGGSLEHLLGGVGQNQNTISILNPVQSPSTPTLRQSRDARGPLMEAGQLPEQITLDNGSTIDLSEYPQDIPTSLSTSGANGTTEKILGNLQILTRELASTGKITPAQAGMLNDLANKGHEIAELERMIETAAQNSNGDRAAFLNATIQLQGQTQTLGRADIASQLGFAYDYQTGEIYYAPESLLGTFLELRTQAENNGSLNDPQVRQTVNSMVNQIVNIANGVETTVYFIQTDTTQNIANFNEQIQDYMTREQQTFADAGTSTITPLSLNGQSASSATHSNSGTICTTGNGQDNGSACR